MDKVLFALATVLLSGCLTIETQTDRPTVEERPLFELELERDKKTNVDEEERGS